MNQILFNKKQNYKKKYLLKIQIIISLLILLILIISFLKNYFNEKKLEKFSETIDKNLKLSYIYDSEKISKDNLYFGKIYIEKINLEYVIFNYYNEKLMKVSPCKFYGNELGEKGNIVLVAHNYNDDRFFSKIDELNLKDIIILEDLNGKQYNYIVFDIFETSENDLSILSSTKPYELTLLTCNNSNGKRIIVKAYMKDN